MTSLSAQQRLAVFVLNKATGQPAARLPVYAELIWTASQPVWPAREWLDGFSTVVGGPQRAEIDQLLRQLLRQLISQEVFQNITPEQGSNITACVRDQIKGIRKPTDWLDPQNRGKLLQILRDCLGKAEIEVLREPPTTSRSAYPLGMLAADHAGYLSFDLTLIPIDVQVDFRANPPNPKVSTLALPDVHLYPWGLTSYRINVTPLLTVSEDCLVVRLELPPEVIHAGAPRLGLPSMQSPSLIDWKMSPGSFALPTAGFLGEDGCEHIFPASVANHEYTFYQVARLGERTNDVVLRVPHPQIARIEIPFVVRLGFVDEYQTTWYHLGHSLGRIVSSFALAPGEQVNIAVVDWTREDAIGRDETTKFNEQLAHQWTRDRLIGETVEAAVSEWQRGASVLGGVAASAGVAGGINVGLANGKGAGGIAASLGASYATSSGDRELSGRNLQKLSDGFSQASAALRELRSTVVIQSSQREKEILQTRVVTNYNHSHALTMLYYELLRHFRVVTKLVRRRPVWLIPFNTEAAFTTDEVLRNRQIIEETLLDRSFLGGFAALEKQAVSQSTSVLREIPDGELVIHGLQLTIQTYRNPVNGGLGHRPAAGLVFAFVLTKETHELVDLMPLDATADRNSQAIGSFALGGFREQEMVLQLQIDRRRKPPLRWKDLGSFLLETVEPRLEHGEPDPSPWDVGVFKVHAFTDKGTKLLAETNDVISVTDGRRKAIDIFSPPAPSAPVAAADAISPADEAAAGLLMAHLNQHVRYYRRALLLGGDALEMAEYLDRIRWDDGTTTALDHVENLPLEVFAGAVAFPAIDVDGATVTGKRLEREINRFADAVRRTRPQVRLITLPSRGVFGEAMLGHCNASEEYDDTRFWDWQQSPIPHLAPEITGVKPGSKFHDPPAATPTTLPASTVNIVNPPSAPDPTGLASALNLLATSNIFRDMSGQVGLAALLGKLSDNSVKIAEVASQSRPSGGGPSSSGGQGSPQSSTPTGGVASSPQAGEPAPVPTESPRSAVSKARALDSLDVSPEIKRQGKEAIANGLTGTVTKDPMRTLDIQLNWKVDGQDAVAAIAGSLVVDVILAGGAKPQDPAFGNPRPIDRGHITMPIERKGIAHMILSCSGIGSPFPEIKITSPPFKLVDQFGQLVRDVVPGETVLPDGPIPLPATVIGNTNDIFVGANDEFLRIEAFITLKRQPVKIDAEVDGSGKLEFDPGKILAELATLLPGGALISGAVSSITPKVTVNAGGKTSVSASFDIIALPPTGLTLTVREVRHSPR